MSATHARQVPPSHVLLAARLASSVGWPKTPLNEPRVVVLADRNARRLVGVHVTVTFDTFAPAIVPRPVPSRDGARASRGPGHDRDRVRLPRTRPTAGT